jgi:ABC-type sugar transport system permease subunit
VGYAGWLSLRRADETLGPEQPFSGLDNYARLFQSSQFAGALGRTAYFSVLTVFLGVAIALGIALLLHQPFRGRTLARVLLLVPWAVPPVVNGIMWHYILDPNWGVMNASLRALGVIDHNVAWLGTPRRALNSLVLAELWKLLPFLTLLFLAGLQGIPENLYRAARIDGASAWKRFVHVTLPGLRAPLLFALIVQTMWSLKVFDTIYVLTQGGPARGTTTLNYFGYLQTFKFLNDGGGAAVAILLMALVVAMTLVYVGLFNLPWNRLRRRWA